MALIYLFLAPLLAHALANAYFHSEDTFNNPVLNPNILDYGEIYEESPIVEEAEEIPVETPVEEDLDSSEILDIDENLDEKSEDDGND